MSIKEVQVKAGIAWGELAVVDRFLNLFDQV